jgi:hypothetical protein
LVAVDGVIYLKRPGTLGKYFRYEQGNPLNPFASGPASRVDPADSLADFNDGITSVTYVGHEEVEGVTVERYEMLVDTRAAGGGRDLPREMTMGVWLDGQDRLARFFMQLGPVACESTLTDFDKPVHVHAPPADQVVEAPVS